MIIVRQDLKMPKGKLCVQCAHAAVEAALVSDRKTIEEWLSQGMRKIVLKVANKRELIKYKKLAAKSGIVNVLVTDAAKTFFKRATTTCLALGPDEEDLIDSITKNLKMV